MHPKHKYPFLPTPGIDSLVFMALTMILVITLKWEQQNGNRSRSFHHFNLRILAHRSSCPSQIDTCSCSCSTLQDLSRRSTFLSRDTSSQVRPSAMIIIMSTIKFKWVKAIPTKISSLLVHNHFYLGIFPRSKYGTPRQQLAMTRREK